MQNKNPFTRTVKGLQKYARLQYNQLLVIWKIPFPYQQTAGFLACRSLHTAAFPVLHQWTNARAFPAYSDEIAQALHLFPF